MAWQVDRVTVKGSINPMEFWTYDVTPKAQHEPGDADSSPMPYQPGGTVPCQRPAYCCRAGAYSEDPQTFWEENPPRTTPLQRDQFAQVSPSLPITFRPCISVGRP